MRSLCVIFASILLGGCAGRSVPFGAEPCAVLMPSGRGFAGSVILRVPMPKPWHETIATHLDAILANGWGSDIAWNDIDHAHLIIRAGYDPFTAETTDDLIGNVAAILYHTAEHAGRWDKEGEQGIPIERRTPRSVIGWPDGRVQPAIELVAKQQDQLSNYGRYGTVQGYELAELRPDLFTLFNATGITVLPDRGPYRCTVAHQFDIVRETNGRNRLPDGSRYDTFLHCGSPKEEGR